jgi:minor extracellular serine protease Vpr
VHRQGAGMLRIDRAIQATTSIEPGKLALGESQTGPATRTLTIRNNGATDVTYSLSHTRALSTGPNTFTPSFLTGFATVAFSAPTVMVPAGGSGTVDVTITAAPALPDKSQYGGYIIVTGNGETERVPYAGFKGDYQSIQVLVPTAVGFPLLLKVVGGSLVSQPNGATYTLQGDDLPFIAAHFDHESRLVRMDVVDANTGKDWHRALQLPYFARNSAATSFFAFSWDGTTTAGSKTYTVPNGQYRIVLTVVKALGDENNPADVETWTSPVITVARP